MIAPVKPIECRASRHDRAGFTVLEVLTAIFVVGVATTIFMSLFTSSMSISRTSTHRAVAAQLAKEYMTEIQVNPGQFAWPHFADYPVGELVEVKAIDEESLIRYVETPTAMPNVKQAYDRESRLYGDFDWQVYARLHDEDSNFVEVLVEINWLHKGVVQRFYLTSAVPRSIGEGIGA